MVHAYVMVKTGAGESADSLESVRGFSEVTEAHIVAGDVDIIAEVEVDEVYDVLQVASSKIQRLDGIVDTRTYIALD